jgi:thioredoxin reductase (NADPH)
MLRYCPVCDGYEITDKKIAVIGSGEHGTSEALFLRGYSRDVTLISADGEHDLDAAQRAALGSVGVGIVAGPATAFRLSKAGISLATAQGRRIFDSVYPALGSTVHSGLAVALGGDRQ